MKQQQGVAVPTLRDPIEHTPSQPRMFYGPPAAPHMHKTSPLVKKKKKKKQNQKRRYKPQSYYTFTVNCPTFKVKKRNTKINSTTVSSQFVFTALLSWL